MVPDPLKSRANCSSGWPLVILGVIAVAGGFVHQNAGAVAVGLLLVAGPLTVHALLRRAIRDLHFERRAPESAFEGDSLDVVVCVENRSRLPLFHPVVSDCFAPELHAQKDVLFPDRILPGEAVEMAYHGACLLPRGIYKLGPLSVTLSDPFGWFQMRRVLEDELPFKVYPAVEKLTAKEELGRCLTEILSELTQRSLGESKEFVWVRDYQRGDPLRRIHWGLTAHRGQPVVREFANHVAGDLHIFVDRYRDALMGIGRASSLEHSVKIAAGLSSHALSRGHRVQLAAGTEDGFHVPAASGTRQLHEVLEVLVALKPHDSERLADTLEAFAHLVRPGSTAVMMISPYAYEDSRILSQMRRWKERGVRVVAIIFDAATFRRLWSQPLPETASREYVERLSTGGIKAYLLPCAADLQAVLAGEAA
ncbi:MAG: DUF58 domain-containing protein [Planctomycetota bacterium]|nr:DUF58 domain-containing protein [Planctomycetota bacterium]